jgi:hypothetical protein
MKLKTEISSQKTQVSSRMADGRHRFSDLRPPASERGIALVITLILLSVTLVMAVAFLAISRRERNSVTTETATMTARLAADSGLANAEAQILATVLQTSNAYNFGLLVSTNYINAYGFDNTLGVVTPANVNYDHLINSATPLTPPQFIQNVANLWFLPRAPVFAYDRNANTNEFRFYLDLNRNGRFDANGAVPVIGQSGGYVHTDGTGESSSLVNVLTNIVLGDPEWIGVLERPDVPHGPNNKFLSRYAFIAMPAGNTLDLNYIHNQTLSPNGAPDGFFRNEGVGTWEINLAAFLADLNTNRWNPPTVVNPISNPYLYNPGANTGAAFEDARALLYWRYAGDYNSLAIPPANLFSALTNQGIDGYTLGNLMTTMTLPLVKFPANQHWVGSLNTNRFFALASDLFDPAKSSINFTNHLQLASGGVSTYDRYTFYRLLAQLGTDSAPEAGKLNVNYVNVDNAGNIVPDMQTNTLAWQPVQFFTNAADRMLRAYTKQWFQADPSNYLATYYGITNVYYAYFDAAGIKHAYDPNGIGLTNIPFFGMTNQIPAFGLTAIPVLVNSNFVYRPAVQRVLQLAANIYDATTNNATASSPDFPSVFRPLFFKKDNFGNVFIRGYTNLNSGSGNGTVSGTGDLQLSVPFDAAYLAGTVTVPLGNLPPVDNIYGVPWIIGAKKGFPNFNEISMQDVVTVTRLLQVTRASLTPGAKIISTNAQYDLTLGSSIGVEFWNSYTNAYTNALQVVVYDRVSANLTNDIGYYQPFSEQLFSQNYSFNYWPGSVWLNGGTLDTRAVNSSYPTNAFYIPIKANVSFMTNQAYQWGGGFLPAATAGWQANRPDLLLPHFGFETTNRLQAFILATDSSGHQRVIDYVHFSGPESRRDINQEIQTSLKTLSYNNMWDTNSEKRGTPYGIASQMGVSQNTPSLDASYWDEKDQSRVKAEIYGFSEFMSGTPNGNLPSGYDAVYQSYLTNLTVQVPFAPTVTAYGYTSWQANDPLVHFLASDLNFSGYDPDASSGIHTGINQLAHTATLKLLPDIGALNVRYQPWGRAGQALAPFDQNGYNPSYKDPLVNQSENWGFPGTKLPSVGWLGRIHRGTPWQTVFLKATNILNLTGSAVGINTWTNWTGDSSSFDAVNSAPVQDRLLFDLFTAALNDNATRGQLPINVAASDTGNPAAGLAAWSAVFSGVAVPTNNAGGYTIINPAGPDLTTNSPLAAIVASINSLRQAYTNGPFPSQGGAFKHLGDILSVPALSQGSQFLKGLNLTNGIPDALMEWLPQQTMGLLRLSDQPRFVIYSYGQTLAPSLNGVVNSGSYAGMITNYQITAETVTRTVVHIEGAPTNAHAVIESSNVLPPD